MSPASRVVLGEVLGPHGRRGALRVRLHGDDVHHLAGAGQVELGADAADGYARSYAVREAAPGRGGEARLRLDGVESPEAAESLAGLLVLVDPERLDPLPPGEFYWYQLVGCAVFDEAGATLGRVTSLLETGAHDVLVVAGDGGTERLFAAAAALLKEVDPEAGRIVIAVPEAEAVVGGDDEPGVGG